MENVATDFHVCTCSVAPLGPAQDSGEIVKIFNGGARVTDNYPLQVQIKFIRTSLFSNCYPNSIFISQ